MTRRDALAGLLLGALSGAALLLPVVLLFPDRAQRAVLPWAGAAGLLGLLLLGLSWRWERTRR